LLHFNDKENVTTRFSANKQYRFLRHVCIYLCCDGDGTYISLTIKENETQVSKMCSAIYQGMYSSVTARQLLNLSDKYPKRLLVTNREGRELINIFTTKDKLISKT